MAKVSSATHSTRWSLIVRAQGQGSGTRVALGELIGHYEKRFIRRRTPVARGQFRCPYISFVHIACPTPTRLSRA